MNIKVFCRQYADDLNSEINKWLNCNPNIKIVERQSRCDHTYLWIIVWYN